MEPIMFVMAILGCGEGDAACRELRVDQARYRSEASCMAATPGALIRHDDLPFPTVVAHCRPVGARPQPLRGSAVLRPAPAPGGMRERTRVAQAGAPRSLR